MERRKYWLFLNKEIADIYAFTDDKNIAKSFMTTRDMDKFICRKCRLDRKSVNELVKDYMKSELKIFEGRTKNDRYQYKRFSVTLTSYEIDDCLAISSLLNNEIISQYAFENTSLLKSKYQKALNSLLYDVVHHYVNGSEESYSIIQDNIYPDQFNIIMDRYGDLFKHTKR